MLCIDFVKNFIVFCKRRARSARIGSARDFVPRKRPRVSGARKRFLTPQGEKMFDLLTILNLIAIIVSFLALCLSLSLYMERVGYDLHGYRMFSFSSDEKNYSSNIPYTHYLYLCNKKNNAVIVRKIILKTKHGKYLVLKDFFKKPIVIPAYGGKGVTFSPVAAYAKGLSAMNIKPYVIKYYDNNRDVTFERMIINKKNPVFYSIMNYNNKTNLGEDETAKNIQKIHKEGKIFIETDSIRGKLIPVNIRAENSSRNEFLSLSPKDCYSYLPEVNEYVPNASIFRQYEFAGNKNISYYLDNLGNIFSDLKGDSTPTDYHDFLGKIKKGEHKNIKQNLIDIEKDFLNVNDESRKSNFKKIAAGIYFLDNLKFIAFSIKELKIKQFDSSLYPIEDIGKWLEKK